jgi:2,4-dienoyl-CoA reductase (NADPH2)
MILLEPLEFSGLKLNNRIVMLATHLGYCGDDGVVTARLIEFYRTRAEYHPGLIIVGGCYTEHLARSGLTMIGLSEDRHIQGLRKLTESIHRYNVPCAAQLYHAGRYSHPVFLGEDPVSASDEFSRITRTKPRALTKDEISATVENFGLAAARAKKAGFDAVEILGSAGYLINQFLARRTNKRDDEYNGDLHARARFALEVVRSVRLHVGRGFPILYRISGEDFVEDGNTLEDNKNLVQWLVDEGVDCINVTGGWHETRVPQTTMDVPRGHYAYLAEEISDVVDVPVIACNRINSPSIAEKILRRGRANLIGMSRAFIADPEFPEKVRSNRTVEIRNCIGCNLGCLDHVFMMEPVICAINPLAGFELERQLGKKGSGKIAVIGGGPSGMEAARILALRGFSVTLFEKSWHLGGLLNLASRVPLRGEHASYVVYMSRELKRLNVDLRLGKEVSAAAIGGGNYDCVVVAAGTIAAAPAIDGVEGSNVTSAYDLIETGQADLGRVGVLGGSSLACHAALYASSHAESVDLFCLEGGIGEDIGLSTRWVILKSLRERGVVLHETANISQVSSKYIMAHDGDVYTMHEADTVVVADTPEPRLRIADKLSAQGMRVELTGSVKRPMNLLECVHDAFEVANTLEI